MKNQIILLAEENPRDEVLTRRALWECNIATAVVVARDSLETLDVLFRAGIYAGRDTRCLPYFVLLDLRLPEMGGLELVKWVRANERTKRVPVIALTSSNEEKHLVQSYNLGAISFVRKPVDAKQVLDATKQLGLFPR